MTASSEHPQVTARLGEFDSHGITRAHHAGRWIEVEHGIPGEIVQAEISGQRRLVGHVIEILQTAPDRVPAPCEYFREWSCGGCQWQHISYPSQIRRKIASVERALRTEGLELAVTRVHLPPEPWRYRSTASISLGKSAGFRRHASLAIVPIRDCPISHPVIGQLLANLNDLIDDGTLPNFRGKVRLEVRLGEQADIPGLQVLIRGAEFGKGNKTETTNEFARPAEIASLLVALQHMDEVTGLSLLNSDGVVQQVKGEKFVPLTILDRPVLIAAESFFQTNLTMLERLILRLQEECGQGRRIADVYGGVGVLGLFLAGSASGVTVVERDATAVEAGAQTAQTWALNNISFVSQSAEAALHNLGPFDVIVLDPPRSGLADPIIETMLEQGPEVILYVSCLAESLVRDLNQLSRAGYQIEGIELFDFYPQTYHVELLAILHRT